MVTERRVEVDVLHKRVIAKILGRWKQLNNFVEQYNAEIRKVGDANLGQL
jgi:hypothetical protein